MQYVVEHPEEMSKVKGLQRQVKEVQTIMENNIQIVCPALDRADQASPGPRAWPAFGLACRCSSPARP